MEQINPINFSKVDLLKMIAQLYREIQVLKERIKTIATQQIKGDVILNRKEAATLLNISLPTLAKLTKAGKFAWYRNGTKIFYNYLDIIESLSKENETSL